ncbi:MAG: hypothetical protein Q7R78_01130 [bacterium]|nr:hypothetical protein [bacterium]
MESPCILFGADSLAVAFKFGRSFRDAEMIIHPPINDFAYSWTGDFDYLLKFCAKAFPDHDVVLITDDQEFAMATQRLNVVFRVVLDASHVPEGSRSANGYPDLKACGIGIADSLEKATFTELEVVR